MSWINFIFVEKIKMKAHVYLVTSELETPWHLKLRRFFRLAKKKETYSLTLFNGDFLPGDILFAVVGIPCIVIDKLN